MAAGGRDIVLRVQQIERETYDVTVDKTLTLLLVAECISNKLRFAMRFFDGGQLLVPESQPNLLADFVEDRTTCDVECTTFSTQEMRSYKRVCLDYEDFDFTVTKQEREGLWEAILRWRAVELDITELISKLVDLLPQTNIYDPDQCQAAITEYARFHGLLDQQFWTRRKVNRKLSEVQELLADESFHEALDRLQEALEHHQRSRLDQQDFEGAELKRQFARIYCQLGDHIEATQYWYEAVTTWEALFPREANEQNYTRKQCSQLKWYADLLNEYGGHLFHTFLATQQREHLEVAQRLLMQSRVAHQQAKNTFTHQYADSCYKLAACRYYQGQRKVAIELFEEGIQKLEESDSRVSMLGVRLRTFLAQALRDAGNADEATVTQLQAAAAGLKQDVAQREEARDLVLNVRLQRRSADNDDRVLVHIKIALTGDEVGSVEMGLDDTVEELYRSARSRLENDDRFRRRLSSFKLLRTYRGSDFVLRTMQATLRSVFDPASIAPPEPRAAVGAPPTRLRGGGRTRGAGRRGRAARGQEDSSTTSSSEDDEESHGPTTRGGPGAAPEWLDSAVRDPSWLEEPGKSVFRPTEPDRKQRDASIVKGMVEELDELFVLIRAATKPGEKIAWDKVTELYLSVLKKSDGQAHGHNSKEYPELVSGSYDGTVKLWRNRSPLTVTRNHDAFSVALWGELLAYTADNTQATFVIRDTPVATTAGMVQSISFSEGEILVGLEGGVLRVLDNQDPTREKQELQIPVPPDSRNSTTTASISWKGRKVAGCTLGASVTFWPDWEQAAVNFTFEVPDSGASAPSRVTSISLSEDGDLLAAGLRAHTCLVWSTSSRVLLHTLAGHTGVVHRVVFSSSGLLATASRDTLVKIWDLEAPLQVWDLRGHQGAVLAVAFSADGHTVASGSEDGTVKLWPTPTKSSASSVECEETLKGHTAGVTCLSFKL